MGTLSGETDPSSGVRRPHAEGDDMQPHAQRAVTNWPSGTLLPDGAGYAAARI